MFEALKEALEKSEESSEKLMYILAIAFDIFTDKIQEKDIDSMTLPEFVGEYGEIVIQLFDELGYSVVKGESNEQIRTNWNS